MLTINHDKVAYREGEHLSQLLEREGYDTTFVAVTVDGALIARKDFDNVQVKDETTIEVFSIMGGG